MENLEEIWNNHRKIMEFQNENLVATLPVHLLDSHEAPSLC